MTEWSDVIYNCFHEWDAALGAHIGESWHFISFFPPILFGKIKAAEAGKGGERLRLTAITHRLNLPDMRALLKLQSSSTDVFFGFLRLLIWWVFHRGPQFLVVHELACAVFGEGAENERSYFRCSWLVRHAKESLGSFPATVAQITHILKAFSLFVTTLILTPVVSHSSALLVSYFTSDKGLCFQ